MGTVNDEFVKGKFTEQELEYAIIDLFQQAGNDELVGWWYQDGETMHRRYDDVLLEDRLRDNLRIRYASLNLTEGELSTIVNKLKYIPAEPLYEGARQTYWLINEGFTLAREDPSLPAEHIEYIDFDDASANDFLVVNQYSVQGSELRCPDLLCFVNGIPLVIWEFKTAIEEDKTIWDAWKQITVRYRRGIPNLLQVLLPRRHQRWSEQQARKRLHPVPLLLRLEQGRRA